MAAAALLKQNTSPTVAQIQQALSGNLCRCGNYLNIIASVQACGDEPWEVRERMSSSSYSLVGNASVTRRDLINRINGTRHWTADISASDIGASSMVYFGRVISPHPSAADQEHRREQGRGGGIHDADRSRPACIQLR